VNEPHAPSAAAWSMSIFGGRKAFPQKGRPRWRRWTRRIRRSFSREEIPPSRRLGAAQLPDGSAHRPRAVQRLPISNYQLMMDLIDYCKNHGIEQIIGQHPDVKEPFGLVFRARGDVRESAQALLQSLGQPRPFWTCATRTSSSRAIVHDLRALPDASISIHVLWA